MVIHIKLETKIKCVVRIHCGCIDVLSTWDKCVFVYVKEIVMNPLHLKAVCILADANGVDENTVFFVKTLLQNSFTLILMSFTCLQQMTYT